MELTAARPFTGVCILNWNAGEALAECVASAKQALAGLPYHIVVVDNLSSDDSLAQLPPQWDKAADIVRLLAPVGTLYMALITTHWLMLSQGHMDRVFRWTAIQTTAYLACFVLGLPWGAIGVAAAFAAMNLLLFIPAFIYAIRGTSIGLIDVLKAMLPSAALMIVSAGEAYAVTTFLAPDWHPIGRLLATGLVIAMTMACGIAVVYGRSFLTGRWLTSEAT